MRTSVWVWALWAAAMCAACDGGEAADASAGGGGAGGGAPVGHRPSLDAGQGPSGGGGQGGGGQGDGAGGAGGEGGAGGAGGAGGEGGGWADAADAGAPESDAAPGGGNTNINLSGSQDFGYFRRQLDDGIVPRTDTFDAAGFFAEHHTPLPPPQCGRRVCLQAMLGVMGNLMNGNNCTMLQLGLNSPIVATPDRRPPLTVAVVVDVSGSMNAEGKIQFVRQGLAQLVNALNDDDRIALVTYSNEAQLAFPMSELRGRRNDLQRIVGGLVAEGGTNLFGGLERGYQEVFDHYDSGRQNRVIFLSDGEPTIGPTHPDDILRMSRGYNSDGVGITSIGLGTSFNYALMRGIAEQGDGNFYFLEDAGAVEEVFTQEIGYFTVPVAFDLHLDVSAGSDYEILRAQGSSFWEPTPDGGRLEVPSVFLAHRVAHDDQTPGGGRRGGGSALLLELMPRVDAPDDREVATARVARVEVSFREPGTDEIVRDTVEVTYPDAPWILREQGFFDNAIVTKSFVMLNIFVTLQMACDLFHLDRDAPGAFLLLQRVIAAARDYEDSANGGEGDEDIRADIELMERLAQVIVNNSRAPAPPPDDAEIPEDPWPAD